MPPTGSADPALGERRGALVAGDVGERGRRTRCGRRR